MDLSSYATKKKKKYKNKLQVFHEKKILVVALQVLDLLVRWINDEWISYSHAIATMLLDSCPIDPP